MSVPSTSIEPAVGRSIPASRLRSVVFPEPDGPMSATNPPASIERSTPISVWITCSPRR